MTEDKRQAAIIEEAKAFVDAEIRPFVNDFEEKGGVPLELIRKMAAKGYLAAPFPEKYGGLGLDPVYYGLFTEVFGKACMATRSLITVHTSLVGETLLRFGTEEQKEKWLPQLARGEKIAAFGLSEPDIGSDAKSIMTTWNEEDDCYVINGRKKWITFGDIADVFIIIASNNGKSTAFIVERSFPGVETKRINGLMAGRATYLAEISLNQVKVPKENVLGKLNFGFEYIVSTALDNGRFSIAGRSCNCTGGFGGNGIYSEAVRSWQQAEKFQLIRGMIGDAVTKIHAARALCMRASELRKQKDPDSAMETTMAKYFTSKVAVDVANDALQIHGGNGFTNQYPVERLYREAKVLEIIEGSSQIQQEIISDFGLKRYYKRSNKS